MSARLNVLFVTWDGPQVSYLEALFLPLFAALKERGFQFHVLQFTWGEAGRIEASRQACARHGIPCRFLKIWRLPRAAGAAISLAAGSRHIVAAINDWKIDILLPRSTLPAVATFLALRGAGPRPVLLDADGLPHDERVDFSGWSRHGIAYRALKKLEAFAVRRADAVLTRSSAAVEILLEGAGPEVGRAKFHVVRNGRDPSLYHPQSRAETIKARAGLGLNATQPLLVYAGSLGGKYCPEASLRLLAFVRESRPDARLMILSRQSADAHRLLATYASLRDAVTILSLEPGQVPPFLAAADIGIALIQPSLSMRAAAAIKIGEYLLCGLPVVATAGVGDISPLLGRQAGIVLDNCDDAALRKAARWIVSEALPRRDTFRDACRKLGLAVFSLSSSISAYEGALLDVETRGRE